MTNVTGRPSDDDIEGHRVRGVIQCAGPASWQIIDHPGEEVAHGEDRHSLRIVIKILVGKWISVSRRIPPALVQISDDDTTSVYSLTVDAQTLEDDENVRSVWTQPSGCSFRESAR